MMSFSRNSFQSKQSVDSSTITTSTLQLSSSTSSTSSSSSSESESSPIFINKVKHQSNHTSPPPPPHSPITQPTLPPTSGEKVKIKERKKENDNKSIIILPSSYQPKSTPITIQPQLKQQPTLSTKSQSNIKPVEEIKDISIIFDTNYYLDCLDNIESYLKRSLKIYNSKHSSLQSTASILQPYYYMIVPQQVLVELDGLKLSNNNYTATRARKASRMLVDSLAVYKNEILFLQSDSEIF